MDAYVSIRLDDGMWNWKGIPIGTGNTMADGGARHAVRLFGRYAVVSAGRRAAERCHRLRCLCGGGPDSQYHEISVTYQLNPATVLKGMNLLVEQGLIEKRRGIGMFVTTGAFQRVREAKRTELLSVQVTRLVDDAKALDIGVEELVHAIEKGYR